MKIIAIDPGYDRLGVAIMRKNHNNEVSLICSQCLITENNHSFSERMMFIGERVSELLDTHKPEAIAIETLFFNKNIKTALKVAHVRGILIYLALLHDCALYEYGPQEIKVSVTGYGKSDKVAVISMVKKLIPNAPKKAIDDEYDAIAVGITCLSSIRL